MGPAEIVASLKELCAEKGPRLHTDDIVEWIDGIRGFESNAVLIAFAKKMKARQYARMLEYEDEDTGMRVKRLWSFRDQLKGGRYYADILEMPVADRKRLLQAVCAFSRVSCAACRKAMADYFAGQRFFDFYTELPEDDEVEEKAPAPRHAKTRSR